MRSLRGAEILIATGNSGKFAEFAELLLPYDARLLSLADFGLGEPEETEFSFPGNAVLKARAAAEAAGIPALADDSGLMVSQLGGAPGLYTADWAETGSGRSFEVAMEKTWGLLEAVGAEAPRKAEFCCVLAVAWPGGEVAVFEGRVGGEIVWPPRGQGGHGYDPIFRPIDHDSTLGEMSSVEKSRLSHRAVAVSRLVADCFT